MLHKRGMMSLVGLPPGACELPIFDVVLNAKTIRGSIVGTAWTCRRRCSSPARQGARALLDQRLERVNDIFREMKPGRIDDRIVLQL
jgi:propanol-preferring alcohol dehydrogenase